MLLALEFGSLADYLFPILTLVFSLASAYFHSELKQIKILLKSKENEYKLSNKLLSQKIEEQTATIEQLEKVIESRLGKIEDKIHV